MDASQITDFLSQYGYWIMLPLMIVEGPVATMLSALMARLDIFNVFVVFILSVLGDILGDVIFYGIGYFLGMPFVEKFGKYIGITEKLVEKVKGYFSRHGGKIIFTVKSTTGLCWATFFTAGVIKMRFKKFLFYSFLGGLIWSSFLVSIGYFYGYLWAEIARYIVWARWLVPVLAIGVFVGIQLWKKRVTKEKFSGS